MENTVITISCVNDDVIIIAITPFHHLFVLELSFNRTLSVPVKFKERNAMLVSVER